MQWNAVAPIERLRNPGNEPQSLSWISFHSIRATKEEKGRGTLADARLGLPARKRRAVRARRKAV